MMKKNRTVLISILTAAVFAAAACTAGGGQQGSPAPSAAPAETTAAAAAETAAPAPATTAAPAETTAAQTTPPATTAAETAPRGPQVYESSLGWSVCYEPELISVTEGQNETAFRFKNAEENVVSVRYIAGQQPEEAMGYISEKWADQASVFRTESFFPGTDDKWGFWRVYNAPSGSGRPSETLIASEYNGGVLMFDIVSVDNGKTDMMAVSDCFSEIINSIQFRDFRPQQMYGYVPGRYVRQVTDVLDGRSVTAEYAVVLNEDHTGKLSFQDDVPVLWGSYMIFTNDGGSSYEYTIEGSSLMLDLDGRWLEFKKEGDANPVNMAMMPAGPHSPQGGARNEAKPAETAPAYGRQQSGAQPAVPPVPSDPGKNSGRQWNQTPSVTEAQAIQTAMQHAGLSSSQITRQKCRLDYEHGRLVYEIDLYVGRMEYEYDIDANTGEILKYEVDSD